MAYTTAAVNKTKRERYIIKEEEIFAEPNRCKAILPLLSALNLGVRINAVRLPK